MTRAICLAACALLCWLSLPCLAAGNASSQTVPEIPIDGAIGPATADFVTDSLSAAKAHHAPLVILRIDTPGGLMSPMRAIIKAILASPIPVVGYVAPSGARAASAGTYILYATNVAAMAPATHLGAATPVEFNSRGQPEQSNPNGSKNNSQTAKSKQHRQSLDLSNGATERRKQINDAAAYIRSLAELRGRNAEWAVHAVRDAASLTASEALKKHVIDLIADNDTALLHALDGRQAKTVNGTVTLHTANLAINHIQPGFETRFLSAITDPTIAYLLLMIGIVGIVAEVFNPGALLPGTIGGLCLLTALYGFHMLPVDFTGAAFLVLGVALIIAEAFIPTLGIVGLVGLVSLIFGSIMLMDTPAYGVSLAVIAAIATGAAALLAMIVYMFQQAHRTRVTTGHEGLLDRECEARQDFDDVGRVWLHGESWRAITSTPVAAGQKLKVVSVEGLTVHVRPAESRPASKQRND